MTINMNQGSIMDIWLLLRLIVFELNDYVQLLNVLLQFLDYLKN